MYLLNKTKFREFDESLYNWLFYVFFYWSVDFTSILLNNLTSLDQDSQLSICLVRLIGFIAYQPLVVIWNQIRYIHMQLGFVNKLFVGNFIFKCVKTHFALTHLDSSKHCYLMFSHLTGTTTPGQRWPGSNGNKGVLCIP